nr:hypothetical protein HK105_007340 [Polyrhizophydium stewartii]
MFLEAPFVAYQQRAREHDDDDAGDTDHDETLQPPPSVPAQALALHPIESLLFCAECKELRCSDCVAEEISCYYCPNCMFEVPSASVKAERARHGAVAQRLCCGRNCFSCPLCTSVLSVVAGSSADGQDVGAAGSGSSIPGLGAMSSGSSIYYLSCPTCRWDSQDSGIRFDRPTGLAAQLAKIDVDTPQMLEFEHLREHYDKIARMFRQPAGAGSALGSLGSSPFLSTSSFAASVLLEPSLRLSRNKPDKKVTPYEPIAKGPSREIDQVAEAMAVPLEDLTTLEQRLRQADGMVPLKIPQRVALRTKRGKRCLACEHIIVKPEPKASSIRFSVKMVAFDRVPRIRIGPDLPPSPLVVGDPFTVTLRVVNPSSNRVVVALDYQPPDPATCSVVFSQRIVDLAPVVDSWDIQEAPTATPNIPDDDDNINPDETPAASPSVALLPESITPALVGANETFVLATVTPTAAHAPIQLPIRMICTMYKKASANSSPSSSKPSAEEGSEAQEPEPHEKPIGSISFWAVVGLGTSGATPFVLDLTTAVPDDIEYAASDAADAADTAMLIDEDVRDADIQSNQQATGTDAPVS